MKTSKRTIIIMAIVCIIFLYIAAYLEFGQLEKSNIIISNLYLHIEYIKNICLGIFTSGLLVLIPSIVQYCVEKRNYYIEIYKISNNILFCALEIISYMEEYRNDKPVSVLFDNFGLRYNEFVSQYSSFAYFLKKTQRDKLIESILCETTKFIKIQEELLKYSKQLKTGDIGEKEYKKCFDIVRLEMINTFKDEFILYQDHIENDIKSLIDDKMLKTYIN